MPQVNRLLIASIAVLGGPQLHAACVYPENIMIPDGASSTYEQMNDSQSFVKKYLAEMETYLRCLEQEKPALAGKLVDDSSAPRKPNRRVALDAMESVAEQFNQQVRAYKNANP